MQCSAGLAFEPLVDHGPRAVPVRIDLTFAMNRSCAGAVEKAFRAHGDRTDAAGDAEVALIAGSTAFRPFTGFFRDAYEAGVNAWNDRDFRVHL